MNTPRIAFLGLGTMGAGMAQRLVDARFAVTVYNRDPTKSALLAIRGAKGAFSPAEAASRADVIISMVSNDEASEDIWLGRAGALAGAVRGCICIECSSISVGQAQALARAAEAKGCAFLDAPVTGSKTEAATGGLKFLVGGEIGTLDKVRPVLAAMSRDIIHLGPNGSGALLKLVNNSLNGVHVAAFAEALALIENSGIDGAKAVGVITNGANGSPIVKTVAARMLAKDYAPNFSLGLLAKDLRYALAEAGRCRRRLSLPAAALLLLEAGIAQGHGARDMAVVAEQTRRPV